MRKLLWLLLVPFSMSAQEQGFEQVKREETAIPLLEEQLTQNRNPTNQPHKSPEEIQAELDSAEAQFKTAQEMFNPWYTGPIVTPSASMMPPANGNIQPYLFFSDTYATFNPDRHSVSLPNDFFSLQTLCVVQTGLTPSVDIITVPTVTANWQDDHSGGGFNDLPVTIGFLVNKQTRYVPQIKFTIQESFPTGKYKNLNTFNPALNSTGSGAYSTQFGFVLAKLFFWTTQHPFNTRLFLGYQLSTTVHVRNFNTYGGGFGTNGTVRPGNRFSTDLGLELSLSQRWVLATDIVYTYTNKTKFHGNLGTNADGTPALVGGGYSDNLSIAPAIEYNWNSSLGVIAGAWFSVYGRNSGNFAQGIISVTYSFP